MFVLGVFPFGANAFFKEVVVGFKGEFQDGGDIVLVKVCQICLVGETGMDGGVWLRRRPRILRQSQT